MFNVVFLSSDSEADSAHGARYMEMAETRHGRLRKRFQHTKLLYNQRVRKCREPKSKLAMVIDLSIKTMSCLADLTL